MLTTRLIVWIFAVGLTVLGTGMASAQNYPNKPIRIVATAAGSTGNFVGRILAEGITGPLGQPVIVDNRSTNTAPEVVAKAPPDGYTVLIAGSSMWDSPFLQPMPYDPVKDFAPITLATVSYQVLVVHPSLPVTSVKELIAFAKTRPGELNIATGQSATAGHFAMELFKSMAGINIVRIPYKGGAASLIGLLGNEAQILFTNDTATMAHAKSGRLRALAVSSAKPTALAPGLPTVGDSGLPGFRAQTTTVVFAPARTPASIINRLNLETVRVLTKAEVKDKLFSVGLESVASSPAELAAVMKSEMATTSKLVKDVGIKAD